MKTMTCTQMGGPCDTPFHGNTADDVIKAQDKHLKEMVAKGDEMHKRCIGDDAGQMEKSSKRDGVVYKNTEGVCRPSRR